MGASSLPFYEYIRYVYPQPPKHETCKGEVILIMTSFIWLGHPLGLYFYEGSQPHKHKACKGEMIYFNSDNN